MGILSLIHEEFEFQRRLHTPGFYDVKGTVREIRSYPDSSYKVVVVDGDNGRVYRWAAQMPSVSQGDRIVLYGVGTDPKREVGLPFGVVEGPYTEGRKPPINFIEPIINHDYDKIPL